METNWEIDYEATLGRAYEYLPTVGFAPWRMKIRTVIQVRARRW